MSQKSYDNSPTLYLIPTPIGNMEDITIRALNILKDVDVIFSEDTRETGALLKYYEISKKMHASHEHNEYSNIEKCIEYLVLGKNVGIVSDRGTPVISDPGYILAKAAIEAGYNVVGLPGATALIPALIMSGINPKPFTFYGFLNSKQSKRKQELKALEKISHTIIFYESPNRIKKCIEDMYDVFGNRQISISREISKRYEEVIRGELKTITDKINNIKGEIVIIVEGNTNELTFDNLSITEHINLYIKEGYTSKDAIKLVAKERKVNKSIIYNDYHNIK